MSAFLAAFLLLSQTSAQQVPQVLDTLQASHPFSIPRGMTGTRQGEWIFIGEGGSLAFIDTGLGQAGFDDAAKRIPIGKTGVIPVRMALDPESAQVPGAGANDLLYIAGGRHGLWVMQADVSAVVVNHAARVDDSGVFNSGLQRSRRWCCDVDFIQIGSERFLLALFQKRGGSRLRLYPLNAARAVIQGQETGSEIQAEFEVRLGSHPFPPIKAANSFAGSMAMAMEVDVVDATPGTEVIDVYVAMGFHGLVRVRLTRDNFLAFTPNPTAPVKSWGPVFGDGTPYTTGGTLVPVGSDPVWYKNLEWVDLDNEAHPGIDLLERSEPPLFADVAVQNQGQDHYLYVAVDHLNWVRFDLDVPWNEQTPISHHEGVPVANHPWGETTFEVVPIKTNGILQHGYTRSLELVQADPDSQGLGLLLVTTVDLNGFHRGSDHFTEGFSFDTVFGLGGVLARFPGGSRTVVYNLADPLGAVPSWNMETWIDFGGRVLFVPPDQDRTPGQVDRLWVVHNNRVDPVANGLDVKANFATCLSEFDVPVTWDGQAPPDPFLTLVRSKCDIPGRKSFRIGHSLVDPDLLLMGNNDALTADGFLVTGQVGGIDVIRSHYDPTLDPCGDDRRGLGGLVFDKDSQWILPSDPLKQYIWGEGSTAAVSGWVWMILRLSVGTDPFAVSPVEDLRWFVKIPKDRFGGDTRRFSQGAASSVAYDSHTRSLPGSPEMSFATHQYPTVEGLWAIRRDQVIAYFEGPPEKPTDKVATLGDTGAEFVILNTHPEFDNMPNNDTAARNFWQAEAPGSSTAIFTWSPELIQVEDPDNPGVLDHWVIAVPCGRIFADPVWTIFSDPDPMIGHPEWLPTSGPWAANLNHSLVQFWDVTDPTNIPLHVYSAPFPLSHTVDNNSPLPKAIGPGDGTDPGMAWKVASVEVSGKVYALVADFGGRALVYEIQDILSQHGQPDTVLAPLEVWDSPSGLVDSLPNAVFDIVVDKISDTEIYVYAAVRRVGIEVLKFDPTQPQGSILKKVARIQTSDDPSGLDLRVDGLGRKTLLLTDYMGGIKIYED